jgi:hypothetical protein
MIKFVFHTVIHIVVLAIGFGIGIHFATQHPQAANSLDAAQEREFLQAQADISQATASKLDQLCNRKNGATADELNALKAQQQQALANLKDKISKISSN